MPVQFAQHQKIAVEELSKRLLVAVRDSGFEVSPEEMLEITPLLREHQRRPAEKHTGEAKNRDEDTSHEGSRQSSRLQETLPLPP